MFDLHVLLTAEGLASLVSLTVMEIVLGIDNIIFIAILSQKVAEAKRKRVRRLGIGLALVMRIGLLMTLSWIMGLTRPLFHVLDHGVSGRDLVLILGGLFLMGKATHELYERAEGGEQGGEHGAGGPARVGATSSFASALIQILLLDIVFSLDSVITAVGMAQAVIIMIVAMVIAVIVMLVFADKISDVIGRHPSLKVLALAFLLLIGTLLVADGFGQHISKGYVYFAMAFSLGVELINMRVRTKARGPSKGAP